MKLHTANGKGSNLFTGYGDDYVTISKNRVEHPVIVTPDDTIDWSISGFDALDARDFERALAQSPEVVLLGTGRTQRFPHPRLSACLAEAGVGLEVMTTGAACRTFNILTAEDRRVVAMLLLD